MMPFWNFFRDIFSGSTPEESTIDGFFGDRHNSDSFRNPIWENDEDDDISDFRHPRGGMHFRIFSDPLEMARFFESEMDSIIKNFGFGFDNSSTFMLPGLDESINALPPSNDSLRDEVLKSDHGSIERFTPNEPKLDTDLDGKITANEFSKVWSNQGAGKELQPVMPFQSRIGKFVTKQIVRGSNGTVERKESVRDSEGNEETKITRQIDNKMYTITTKKDKNGLETRTEDLVNIGEDELKNFTEKWTPLVKDNTNSSNRNESFSVGKLFWPSLRLRST